MTVSSNEIAPSPLGGPAPRWVLLAQEAATRGFRNVLAFRRWCRRRGVPIRLDGRKQWVSPVDVDRAISMLPAEVSAPAPGCVDLAVKDAVSALMQPPARVRRSRAAGCRST